MRICSQQHLKLAHQINCLHRELFSTREIARDRLELAYMPANARHWQSPRRLRPCLQESPSKGWCNPVRLSPETPLLNPAQTQCFDGCYPSRLLRAAPTRRYPKHSSAKLPHLPSRAPRLCRHSFDARVVVLGAFNGCQSCQIWS